MSSDILNFIKNTPSPEFFGNGGRWISSADGEVTTDSFGLLAVTDVTLDGIVFDDDTQGAARLVGVTIPARTFIPGIIKSVQISDGVAGLGKLRP